jgi:hypothetical protein
LVRQVLAACRRHRIRFKVTVRQTTPVTQAITHIPDHAWTDITYPDGGLAQVAETTLPGLANSRAHSVVAVTRVLTTAMERRSIARMKSPAKQQVGRSVVASQIR